MQLVLHHVEVVPAGVANGEQIVAGRPIGILEADGPAGVRLEPHVGAAIHEAGIGHGPAGAIRVHALGDAAAEHVVPVAHDQGAVVARTA